MSELPPKRWPGTPDGDPWTAQSRSVIVVPAEPSVADDADASSSSEVERTTDEVEVAVGRGDSL